MSDDLLLRGLATRSELSDQDEIDNAFADPSPCMQTFEQFVTEQYWGACWSDKTLTRRERSWLFLGIAAATGRSSDFADAVKAAIRSGVSEVELGAAIRQIVLSCGVSTGSECMKVAREVLALVRRESATEHHRNGVEV